MKTLTRGYCIQEDITDPTPWEEPASEPVCECALCGEEIDTDSERVYTVDGLEGAPMCERCFCFRKFTPDTLLDILSIEITRRTGARYARMQAKG